MIFLIAKYILILILLNKSASFLSLQTLRTRCYGHTVRMSTPGLKNGIITDNRQANAEYEFEEKYHAGIQLFGSEVKSCRVKGSCNLKNGFVEIRNGEAWLFEVHIAEAKRCGPYFQHEPKRTRKLLLHHQQILKLEQMCLQRNMELIPTELYWSDKNFVKVEIGVGKKKSINDKRDGMIKRDGERSIRRVMKGNYD